MHVKRSKRIDHLQNYVLTRLLKGVTKLTDQNHTIYSNHSKNFKFEDNEILNEIIPLWPN